MLITERDIPGPLLGNTEAHFRTLIDHAPVMLWLADPDARCTYLNRTWLNFSGRSLEQELGDGWTEGVHPDDLQRCLTMYLSSLGNRSPFSREYRLLRADGEYRWLLDNGVPLYDVDGSFCGYMGSCSDITERRQSEASARWVRFLNEAGEECFRATFEQATVGMAHISLVGEWIRVNERLCAIVGYSREELLGKTFQEITHPDDLEADVAQRQRLLAGEISTYSLEKRYVRQDGSPVWIELTVSLIRERSGGPKYLLKVVQDIDAQKKAQRMRDQVPSLVLHDLRNPLGAISMSTSFLLEVPLPEEQRNAHLRIIERAASRMNRLLQNLADVRVTGHPLHHSGTPRCERDVR